MPPRSFDVAICYNSSSTAQDLLFAVGRKISNRVGYPDKGFSGLVTFPIKINFPQPYPAYFRDLVSQIVRRVPDWPLCPQIFPTPHNRAEADAIWNQLRLNPDRPVVACFATSRQLSGVWPATKFAESLRVIETSSDAQTILCGTASDAETLHYLKQRLELRAQVVSGQLCLLSLACFLQRCTVVLCPDSGPRHLANAVGTPAIFVRNFAVGRVETGTYCETEIDVAPDLERVPKGRQAAAFASLDPAEVARVVVSRLQ
jgi:ADP-heptose:LPS heptosyltransferase